MDQRRSFDSNISINGVAKMDGLQDADRKRRNYKLLVDPQLKQGPQKVYRFDGMLPGDPSPVKPKDPRSRMLRFWAKKEIISLPVPKFKYDSSWVGTILPKEVTFTNLNDNINEKFLKDMCKTFGKIDECKIYHHPKTKKHLGIGKVHFTSTRSARTCAEKLNQTSKMGNIMTVFLDTMGKERSQMLDELTQEKVKRPPSPLAQAKTETHSRESAASNLATPANSDLSYASGLSGGQSVAQSEMSFSGQSDFSQSTQNTPLTPAMSLQDHINQFSMAGMGHQPPLHPPPRLPPQAPPPHHHMPNPAMGPPPPMVPSSSMAYNVPPPEIPPSDSLRGINSGLIYDDYNHPPEPESYGYEVQDTYRNMSHDYGSHSYHSHSKDRNRHRRNSEQEDTWNECDRHDRHGDRAWNDRHWEDHKDDYYRDREDKHRSRKHRHRDRHQDHRGHDRHRERERDGDHDNLEREVQEEKSPPVAVPPLPSTPVTLPPPPEPKPSEPVEETRPESLESRIQFLLQQNRTDTETDAEDSAANNSQEEAAPPLPPSDMPPLPEEEPPPPPLPPEPEDEVPPPLPGNGMTGMVMSEFAGQSVYGYAHTDGMVMMDNHLLHQGLPLPPGAGTLCNQEDDRMSLASLSSGEEKLQVTTPFSAQSQVSGAPPISMHLHNNYLNNLTNAYGMHSVQHPVPYGHAQNSNCMPPEMVMTPVDEKQEKRFLSVVDQVISELKVIMRRDLRKKMVESSAFKSYENWWERKTNQDKKPAPGPSISATLKSATKTTAASNVRSATNLLSTTPALPKPADPSHSISALFDNKDGSLGGIGFGSGGLLGLRGGVPKLPSFRKKFRPPSPPPEEEEEGQEEEEEETSFRGPRTPEESENEDRASEISGASTPVPHHRHRHIYSDESDEETPVDSSEEEVSSVAGSSDEEYEAEEEEEEEGEEHEEASEEESEEDASEDEEAAAVSTADKYETPTDLSDVESSIAKLPSQIKSEEEATENERSMDVEETPKAKIEEPISKPDEIKPDTELSPKSVTADEDDSKVTEEEEDDEKDEPIDVVNGELPTPMDISGDSELKEKLSAPDMISEKAVVKETAMDVDSGLEKDAALALLQMHDYKKSPVKEESVPATKKTLESVEVKEEPQLMVKDLPKPNFKPKAEAPKKPQISAAQAAMQVEHNYSALPKDSPVKKGGKDKRGDLDTDVTDSASEGEPELIPCLPPTIQVDHNYCHTYFPMEQRTPNQRSPTKRVSNHKLASPDVSVPGEVLADASVAMEVEVCETKERTPPVKGKGGRGRKLADVTNLKSSRELAALLPPPRPKLKFKPRTLQEEVQITYDFLLKGIDSEDQQFLARRYEELLQDDSPQTFWLNETHWVEHPVTLIPDPQPPKKKKVPTATLR